MDNVTADPGIQLHRYHSHLGHTIKWSWWPPGECTHCFFYSAKIVGSGSLPNFICRKQETLLRICCAMLILVRKRLLAGDFTSNLKLLQNYPPTNISHLLYVANKLQWTDLFCAWSAAVFVRPKLYRSWVPALQPKHRTEPLRRWFMYHVR